MASSSSLELAPQRYGAENDVDRSQVDASPSAEKVASAVGKSEPNTCPSTPPGTFAPSTPTPLFSGTTPSPTTTSKGMSSRDKKRMERARNFAHAKKQQRDPTDFSSDHVHTAATSQQQISTDHVTEAATSLQQPTDVRQPMLITPTMIDSLHVPQRLDKSNVEKFAKDVLPILGTSVGANTANADKDKYLNDVDDKFDKNLHVSSDAPCVQSAAPGTPGGDSNFPAGHDQLDGSHGKGAGTFGPAVHTLQACEALCERFAAPAEADASCPPSPLGCVQPEPGHGGEEPVPHTKLDLLQCDQRFRGAREQFQKQEEILDASILSGSYVRGMLDPLCMPFSSQPGCTPQFLRAEDVRRAIDGLQSFTMATVVPQALESSAAYSELDAKYQYERDALCKESEVAGQYLARAQHIHRNYETEKALYSEKSEQFDILESDVRERAMPVPSSGNFEACGGGAGNCTTDELYDELQDAWHLVANLEARHGAQCDEYGRQAAQLAEMKHTLERSGDEARYAQQALDDLNAEHCAVVGKLATSNGEARSARQALEDLNAEHRAVCERLEAMTNNRKNTHHLKRQMLEFEMSDAQKGKRIATQEHDIVSLRSSLMIQEAETHVQASEVEILVNELHARDLQFRQHEMANEETIALLTDVTQS